MRWKKAAGIFILHRKPTDGRFQCARGSQCVSREWFRSAHRHAVAKQLVYNGSFHSIVRSCARSVKVQVLNATGRNAGA